MQDENGSWKVCSSCKKSIAFGTAYWVCSVSTCNQKRTGWIFCRVECWDAHIPKMNHRECWAVEMRSPVDAHGTPRKIGGASDELAGSESQPEHSEETTGSFRDPSGVSPKKQPTSSAPRTIIRRRAN